MSNFSWSVDMSAQISGIVREESPNNYKHVVMTMIGSVAELGFHLFSTYALPTLYKRGFNPERVWMRPSHGGSYC